MIKIFNKVQGFEEKVNFVDNNNCLVGYDLRQSCSEHAYWIISTIPKHANISLTNRQISELQQYDLSDYEFYNGFILKDNINHLNYVSFKMLKYPKYNLEDVMYLHLVNVHNGYYAPGS